MLIARAWLRVLLFSVIGLLFYVYLYYSNVGDFPNLESNWQSLLVTLLAASVAGYFLKVLNIWLDSVKNWGFFIGRRLAVGIVANALVIGVAILLIWGGYLRFFGEHPAIYDLWDLHGATVIKLMILAGFFVIIYSVVYTILYAYKQFAEGQISAIQTDRRQMELQFDVLKSQLSPHYLFNSLNTISSLIDVDKKQAETFIRRLVESYEYVLNTKDKKLVSLSEELDSVRAYIYLLRVRFGDALNVDINIPSEVLGLKVPPLTLQLLVENAVKHNVISMQEPLSINIFMDGSEKIRVSNNRTETPANQESFKIGLDNIKKRYVFYTQEPVQVFDKKKFEVALPLLKVS